MNAWTMSKALSCRPSEVYGFKSPLLAYWFDSAVTTWGMAFQNALDAAGSDAKDAQTAARARARIIRRWIPSQAQYRNPDGG